MGLDLLGSVCRHKNVDSAGKDTVGVIGWRIATQFAKQPHLEECAGGKLDELACGKVHVISHQRSLIDMMLKKVAQHHAYIVWGRHEKRCESLGMRSITPSTERMAGIMSVHVTL